MGGLVKLTAEQKTELAVLIPRIKKGDSEALSKFIKLTQTSVFRFCFFLSKNREQADEFCQETFLKAMDNFKNIENEKSALDWLLKIAKNLFLDQYRSAKRQNEILNENFYKDETAIESSETSIEVRQILSHFDPDDRSLLILVDLDNYTYSEAASIMDLSEDAVRSRIHRIRQNFQKILMSCETK